MWAKLSKKDFCDRFMKFTIAVNHNDKAAIKNYFFTIGRHKNVANNLASEKC